MDEMVSLQFALDRPDMVRSLILVGSYPYAPQVIREALEKWNAESLRPGRGPSGRQPQEGGPLDGY
jgi:pimeloyl-ACP methyl ester carboxylesterase